jgi:hypothetical protein
MSYYYNYNFISPVPIHAEIKEEMASYFNTGVIDDTMFPIYTNRALEKLGRVTYKIDNQVLEIKDHEVALPSDFKFVREVWLCTNIIKSRRDPSYFYDQQTCVVAPAGQYDPCNPCDTCPDKCHTEYSIVHKTSGQIHMTFNLSFLLKPGNIAVKTHCSKDCKNFGASGPDSFDIRDGKLITNFSHGDVYLVYYKIDKDDEDYQLVPDNYYIKDWVRAFIKYKMYEKLWNEIVDETSAQIERKYQEYKEQKDMAWILAETEVKKQTIDQKVQNIRDQRKRLNHFKIGYGSRRHW